LVDLPFLPFYDLSTHHLEEAYGMPYVGAALCVEMTTAKQLLIVQPLDGHAGVSNPQDYD